MRKTIFKCTQFLDERGIPEEFTNDLLGLIDVDSSHLDIDALPRIGTQVRPGMILIGKLGGKKGLDERNHVEFYVAGEEGPNELRAYWESHVYDGSLYALPGCGGKVLPHTSRRTAKNELA